MSDGQNKPPLFIFGSQRSGTTMLRLMLNNHSSLAIPHETAFITIYFRKLQEYGELSKTENARRLLSDVSQHPLVRRGKLIADPEEILVRRISNYREFIEAIFQAYADRLGKPRWGDKTPFYTPDIDIIRRIFPDSKMIHLVRDGRDVVLSQRSIEWMSNNFPKLVRDWQWKTTLVHKVGAVLGDDFLEIRYEDLVNSPEDILRQICAFLEEPYDSAMLNYSETAKTTVPAESLKWHRKSIQPPDPSQLGKWKTALSKAERIIFEQIAGDTLELFGYEREHLAPTLTSRMLKLDHALRNRS